MKGFVVIILIITLITISQAKRDHTLNENDVVPLFVNKIGPLNNPSETYSYYQLPFCKPNDYNTKPETIGEILAADRFKPAPYTINFLIPVSSKKVCTQSLTRSDVNKFRNAIKQEYYFQMLLDDLPIEHSIGYTNRRDGKIHLFNHLLFSIAYNGKLIVQVNVSFVDPGIFPPILDEIDEKSTLNINFTYTVRWIATNYPFEHRDRISIYNTSLPMADDIHWLSIMNSLVLVVLLLGFLAIILLRTLRSDYSRYSRAEENNEDQEEYGWKLIYGDVFRFPQYKSLFSALLGNGAQLLLLILGLLILAVWGVFYPENRGGIYTAAIALYSITAGIAGYISASVYKKMIGKNWAWNLILASALFMGPTFVIGSFANTVSIAYEATTAVPFGTIMVIVLIWSLVTFPLMLIGGISGKNLSGSFDFPCRIKAIPREIPPIPWYRNTASQMVIAGFLPFSAIYIELYYLFAAIWGRLNYTLFGILLLVFIILVAVTACVTIALTYFQLNMEDHHWWWRSFLSGGATGLFIYAYAWIYYYRTEMGGFLQGVYYFGYMFVICYGFFVMLGTVGFYSSLLFIRKIYAGLKTD